MLFLGNIRLKDVVVHGNVQSSTVGGKQGYDKTITVLVVISSGRYLQALLDSSGPSPVCDVKQWHDL